MFLILTTHQTQCKTFTFFVGLDLETGLKREEIRTTHENVQKTMTKHGFRYSCTPNLFSAVLRQSSLFYNVEYGIIGLMDMENNRIACFDTHALTRSIKLDTTSTYTSMTSILLAMHQLQIDLTVNLPSFCRGKWQRNHPASIISVFNEVFFPNTSSISVNIEENTGGLTLPCTPGLHTDVVAIDVDSMYPTIMLVHGLVDAYPCLRDYIQQGLHIKQRVHSIPHLRKLSKYLLNTLYGAFGCRHFNAYNLNVMRRTCAIGRQMIKGMKTLVELFQGNVIYGVTASIFATNIDYDLILSRLTEKFPFFSFSIDKYPKMVIVTQNHYVALKDDAAVIHRGTLFRQKNANKIQKKMYYEIVSAALQCFESEEIILMDVVEKIEEANRQLSQDLKESLRQELFRVLQHTGHASILAVLVIG